MYVYMLIVFGWYAPWFNSDCWWTSHAKFAVTYAALPKVPWEKYMPHSKLQHNLKTTSAGTY